MNSELQIRLLDALFRCLRPIAKVLLGAGVNYAQFEELAKRAFVEQSLGERDSRGRVTNVSRVAVRTGLSRKEVARIREKLLSNDLAEGTVFRSGRPARVLQLWHSHPLFQDNASNPIDLAFDEGERNFTSLVKLVGGDIPVGAVRAELLSAGGMVELPDGKLRVSRRHFVPVDFGEDLVVGFAFIVAPLLETLERNASDPINAFIQRVSYSENLPVGELQPFKVLAHRHAEQFVQSIDEWLTEHEENPMRSAPVGKRVGVGVYYFESDSRNGA